MLAKQIKMKGKISVVYVGSSLTVHNPQIVTEKERSYSGVTLACLKIRSRNEEAINSQRNRIFSLKVFLLPTLSTSNILQDIYFLFVSELI